MGRGGSSFGGSSSGRGSSSFGGGGSRSVGGHSHTTVFVGGHRHYHGGNGSPVIGIVVGAIFMVIGLIVSLFGVVQCFQINDYSKVTAVCVDNEYSSMDGYYYTIYDYTVDGKFYDNVRSNQGWQFKEKIGKEVTIYYLESNPSEISEDCPVSLKESLILIGFGLVFAAFGSIPMILCIKQLKNSKAGAGAEAGQIPIAEETHTRCQYCGAKYNKKSDSCPKCGAGKME